MSARSIFILGLAGVLGFATLATQKTDAAQVLTLERGLGPTVETTQL